MNSSITPNAIPEARTTSRALLTLTTWLAAFAAFPTLAAAAPNCPALGPSGFGVSLTNAGVPLDGYLALLTIDTAGPVAAGAMRPDGGDLRVSDQACSPLGFWVESGFNTAATRVWVKVPSVPAGESRFYVHHGDLTLTRANQASDVFGASVASLYTFTEGTGTVVHDWVGGHDLQVQGSATWTTGPRGEVGGITGLTTGRLLGSDNGAQLGAGDFSTFVMVNLLPTDRNGSTRGLIGNYNTDGTSGWVLKMQGGAGQFMLLTNQGGGWCQASGGNVPAGSWNMLGARRQAGVANSLFHNGAASATICTNDTRNVNGVGPFEIGRGYNGNAGYAMGGVASMAVVYTRAVTDQEASDLYRSLFPATPPTIAFVAAPPGAPTIATTTSTTNSITLSFSPGPDGGSPITSFTATCAAGAQFSQSGPSSPLTVTGLAPEVTYTCTVTATNAAGTSAPSAPVSVTTAGPPHPPVDVRVTADGALVSLDWDAAGTGASAEWFQIEVGTVSGLTNVLTHLTRGSGEVGLLPDGLYFLRVRAVNEVGTSAPSREVSIQVAAGRQLAGPVSGLTATVAGDTVTLSWQRSTLGINPTGYRLEVGQSHGSTDVGIFNLPASATSFTVRGVPTGVYSVRVRAVAPRGYSPPSHDVMFVVGGGASCASAPVPPVLMTPVITGSTVAVSWLPQADFPTTAGYRLHVGSTPGASDLGVFSTSFPITTFVANAPTGTYYLRLVGLNACGESAISNDQMAIVGPVLPAAPTGLTAQVSGSSVTLSWTPPPGGVTGYVLEAGSSPGATALSQAVGSTASSLTVNDVTPGTYYVRLKARNAAGTGPASNEVVVVVP